VTKPSKLTAMLSGGKQPVRRLKAAQILLAAHAGLSDEAIAQAVGASGSTVYRTKRRFVVGRLEVALDEEPRPARQRSRRSGASPPAAPASTGCSPPTRPGPSSPRATPSPRSKAHNHCAAVPAPIIVYR